MASGSGLGTRLDILLLFFATAAISVVPKVVAQPGNMTEEGYNITVNATRAAGVSYGPLQVNSSSAAEEESNIIVITSKEPMTAGIPVPQLLNSSTVAQEGSPEAHPTACIRSLADLRQAYLDFKTAPGSRPQDNTIFSYHPTDAVKYTSLAIFYDYSTEEDGDQLVSSSLNSQGCCNPQNTRSCKAFLRYYSHLYSAIYPPLIFMYAFPPSPFLVSKLNKSIETKMNKFGVRKLCWKVPPFCNPSKMFGRQSDQVLLKEFTAQFPHLVLSANEGPIQVGPVDQYKPGKWEKDKMKAINKEEKIAINSMILCVFIAIIPLFLLTMDTYSNTISTVLIKSRFAANCLHMVMLQSWFWALYFIFNTVQILRALLYFAQQSNEKYLNEILMPDVVLCFTLFGVEMVVILIELPFICSYVWNSPVVRDVHVRKTGLSGLLKLRKAAESMGWMGIVVFCQMFSVMVCYMVLFLFINPLYTITRVGNTVLFIAVFAVLFALCCTTCSCVSCTWQKCHKYFLMTMIFLVTGCTNFLAYKVLPEPFTDQTDKTDSMVTGILSSVVSSVMLALFGYIGKTLVWNQISQEVQEFEHEAQSHDDNDVCEQ